jgi:NTP pyrophosphatase (non-canonical NTP hydrolase)
MWFVLKSRLDAVLFDLMIEKKLSNNWLDKIKDLSIKLWDAKKELAQLKQQLADLKSNPPPNSLGALTKEVREWSDYNWPLRARKDPLCSAVEELGELMRAETKGEQGIRGTPEHWDEEAKKEWVDVFVALLDYASIRNWNLGTVIRDRWAQLKRRDWQKFKQNGVSK